MKTAIIGAGASGLSIALMLQGENVIFEHENSVGGHCRSTIRDGWTFDKGPHIMFSRNKDVLDFMVKSLGDNVFQSKRNNRVFINERMVKYPIENDLASLDLETRTNCLLNYLFNSDIDLANDPKNLDDWFIGNFGSGMTDLYFRPYNEKIWKVPLHDLSMTWSERIPSPPPTDVVKGALGVSTEGYLHQLYYSYPLDGGYQAITDAWEKLLKPGSLRLNTKVVRIQPSRDGVEILTEDGPELFDHVVSTVPMSSLVQMIDDVPDRVFDAINNLRINPINVITLGYRGTNKNKYTAVYIADSKYLPNRISGPSVFSPQNAPKDCYSLQAEITFPPGQSYLNKSDSELLTHVQNCFIDLKLVEMGNDPIFHDIQRIENAYVVYTNGYEQSVDIVKNWARSLNIDIHGRFGSFDYLNVDGCVIRSLELASQINGRPTKLPSPK